MADCGTKVCAVEECGRPSRKRSWCTMHYQRWRAHGDPLLGGRSGRSCSVDRCDTASRVRGMCRKHYQRWQRNGEATSTRSSRASAIPCKKCGADRVPHHQSGYTCVACTGLYQRQYIEQWYSEHADEVRQRAAEWYRNNLDAARRYRREHRAANLEAFRQRGRDYHARCPEVAIAASHRRKARKLEAVCEHGEGCVTPSVLKRIRERPCHYCSAPTEHADHYVPLARGGLHCRDNLVPSCAPCNRSKHALLPDEWLARLAETSTELTKEPDGSQR